MTLLHSLPALLSMVAAVSLTLWGTIAKNGFALRFAGALCAGSAVVCALVDGAALQETLIYMMVLLLLSLCAQRPAASDEAPPSTQDKGEHAA
jgi:membrane protein implicated in regulation of membrane protease activity